MTKKTFSKKLFSSIFAAILVFSTVTTTFTASAANDVATIFITLGGGGRAYLSYSTLTKPKKIYSSLQRDVAIGEEIQIVADETEVGDAFMYWVDNASHKILSFDKTFKQTLYLPIRITGEFASKGEGKYIVRYINNAGVVLSCFEQPLGTKVRPPKDPQLPGFKFIGWDKTPESFMNSTEHVIVRPIYEPIAVDYSVKISNTSGCTGAGTYSAYKMVKVTAAPTNAQGKTFSYWKDSVSGQVVSYYSNYSFYINSNVELTAVYGEPISGDAVAVRITGAVTDAASKSITFYAERSVDSKFTIIHHGMMITKAGYIARDPSSFNLSADRNVIIVGSGKSFEKAGTYSLTKNKVLSGDLWYARGYVVYKDELGVIKTAYSDITKGYSF